ncbi:MAG TPA: non-homologous end-joining DNA ligase [Steroidobacteraceae bacterium]|nr:non-homologous end-joining DNA ligase [Steroidobacteraceae bacterium]
MVSPAALRQAAGFVVPMAAQSVKSLPRGAEWLYEPKLDGYRALLLKQGSVVRLLSRNEKELTAMYPGVAAAGLRLNAREALLDGEIVAVADDGRPSFQALQHRSSHPRHRIVFYAFDVLHLDGRNLMAEPLTARRARLPKLIGANDIIRQSQDLPGSTDAIVQALQAAGIEGVVAKRRNSTYQPGERSGDWVKLKLERQQELVIGGYRPAGSAGVDALLVGYYERGDLMFAGKVRAGFTPHIRRELLARLGPLAISECPFSNLPDASAGHWGGGVTADQMREMRWTAPQLVAQIRFTEWTADKRLRHAAFLGLRVDKAASDVRRES